MRKILATSTTLIAALSTLSVFVPQARGASLGLVGYWKFDEGSGIVASDSSGYGNNGTLMNGPLWVDGKYGKALDFDGIDDYVQVSDTTDFYLQELTVGAWIKPRKTSRTGMTYLNDQIVATNVWGINTGWEFKIDTLLNQSGLHYGNINGWQTNTFVHTVYPFDTWTHVTATFKEGVIKWYINGELFGTIENTNPSILYTSPGIAIGSLNGGDGAEDPPHYFNGTIDEVHIYNRSLTEEEIKWLYLQPVGGIWIPVNKLELLAPYIGLTILLAVAVITAGYVKKRT